VKANKIVAITANTNKDAFIRLFGYRQLKRNEEASPKLASNVSQFATPPIKSVALRVFMRKSL
jgi:hypothetical protein